MSGGRKMEWHVLGLSGGRDSAALAVYMRQNHPELDIDYFFTDTGKELPEVYEFLVKLEGFLGKPILRLNPDRDFDFWLKQYNNFLPSAQTRWCTRKLKLRPFEQWIRPALDKGDPGIQLCRHPCRRGIPRRLLIQACGPCRSPALQGCRDRQGRGAGDSRWCRAGPADILSVAHAQRLHLLLLPTEDRVGKTDGAASEIL